MAQEQRVLHYFVDLISRRGLSKIKEDFKNPIFHNIDYDPRTNSVVGRTVNEDVVEEINVSFDNHLRSLLEPQFDRALAEYEKAFLASQESAARVYLDRIEKLDKDLVLYGEDEGREVVGWYLNRLKEEIQHLVSSAATEFNLDREGATKESEVRPGDGRVDHKQNKGWIIDKYRELREQDPDLPPSKIYGLVQVAYGDEFKKYISDSTIRTYLGKKKRGGKRL